MVPSRASLSFLLLAFAVLQGCADRDLANGGDAGSDEGDMTDEGGGRPSDPGAMYSACEASEDCDPLRFCVRPPGEPGYCSAPCLGDADTEPCDPSPGGSAELSCAEIGSPSRSLCALDCGGGARCPAGMRCETVMANDRARSLCF